MDDKQKLFRLTKRLNADGAGGNASGPSERLQPASRAARNSRHYTNMDTITAQMKAQMLDGDAALLDLANEPDEGLLLQARPACLQIHFREYLTLLYLQTVNKVSTFYQLACFQHVQLRYILHLGRWILLMMSRTQSGNHHIVRGACQTRLSCPRSAWWCGKGRSIQRCTNFFCLSTQSNREGSTHTLILKGICRLQTSQQIKTQGNCILTTRCPCQECQGASADPGGH
jgi:hypothetical protein